MNEPELIEDEVVAGVLNGLTVPVKTSFLKAISDLLGGLTAIPAAKLRQYAQAIEDTTTARSMTAVVMAKAAVDKASEDPLLMQAAAEVFLPTALRKAKNRLNVAQSAAEHLAEVAVGSTGNEAVPPGDDWMNSFIRFAEDASSERMQDLFGRILAGQVLRPGAFGLSTLRVLSELDQEIASDFSLAWTKNVGQSVDYSPEWQRGDGFSRWMRLSEFGLMAPTQMCRYLPPFNPTVNGNTLWTPMQVDDVWLNVFFQQGASTAWKQIEFTRVGREIGSLLPKPNYEENMRQVANRLPRNGLTRIELYVSGKPAEVIWKV